MKRLRESRREDSENREGLEILTSSPLCTEALFPLFNSSLAASPFKSAYVAAKHGMIGLTKSVALEVAQKGITVNSICPGYVKTPLVMKPDR